MPIKDTPLCLKTVHNMRRKDHEKLVANIREKRVYAGIEYKKNEDRKVLDKQNKIALQYQKQCTMMEKELKQVDNKLEKMLVRVEKIAALGYELDELGVLKHASEYVD